MLQFIQSRDIIGVVASTLIPTQDMHVKRVGQCSVEMF
jgi:hypothetical protein